MIKSQSASGCLGLVVEGRDWPQKGERELTCDEMFSMGLW